MHHYEVIILGGGLAGLTTAISLNESGISTLVIEKNCYPCHKVCGEYVSREVLPLFQQWNILEDNTSFPEINRLMVSAPNGSSFSQPLDLGGIGISRFYLDDALYQKVLSSGSNVLTDSYIESVDFHNAQYIVRLRNGDTFSGNIVVGAFGKRSSLDRMLGRKWFRQKSPWYAVKYHIETDFPNDLIALHNFDRGYCGISKVENNRYCLCYLAHRSLLKKHRNIATVEKEVLSQNPHLHEIWHKSMFTFEKPLVINEISFEQKPLIEEGILMAGDSAGMIAPLCGNGMAMAINSGRLLSQEIFSFFKEHHNMPKLENDYTSKWNNLFYNRLRTGRNLQHLFGHQWKTNLAVSLLKNTPGLTRNIIKRTHGKPFY